jgi:hypothetical protein
MYLERRCLYAQLRKFRLLTIAAGRRRAILSSHDDRPWALPSVVNVEVEAMQEMVCSAVL